jgi:hypothetical protein
LSKQIKQYLVMARGISAGGVAKAEPPAELSGFVMPAIRAARLMQGILNHQGRAESVLRARDGVQVGCMVRDHLGVGTTSCSGDKAEYSSNCVDVRCI